MSPAPENPPVQPDDLLLFSLISAEFDGELSPSEVEELRKLERLFPDRANAYRVQCAQLREKLQQLPVIPSQLQWDILAAQCRPMSQASTSTPLESSPPIPLLESPRPRMRHVMAVATTLIVCVVCAILLRPPFPDQSAADRTSFLTDSPFPPASPDAAATATMQVPAPAAAAASPAAVATASPAASAEASSPAIGELQPLLTESEWQVVVVRVRRGGPEDVLKELREVLARHGLTLARSQPVTTPEWLGVFLPATIPQQKSLLDEVQQGLVVDAPEWDPAEIMRSSRDSILRAVRQSLESPTRSELSGGEVFVAVSPAISDVEPVLAKSLDAAARQMGGAPASVAAGGLAGERQAPGPKKPRSSALLLVFEFSPEAGGAGQRQIY